MAAFSQAGPTPAPVLTARSTPPRAEVSPGPGPGAALTRRVAGIDPRKLQPAQVLQLQRTYGNQAVMRLLAQRKPTPAPAPTPVNQSQVQRKVLEWANPVLQSAGIAQPAEGKTEAAQAANALSVEVDKAVEEINMVVVSYNAGLLTPKEALGYLERFVLTYHVDNFINKMIDWQAGGTGKQLNALKRSAGYVIEGFADAEAAKLLHQTQYVSGGARPDYRIKTGKTYDFKGKALDADGLLDATSEAEALKGHISEKVTRMEPADALTHPHLYDVYYEDLGIGPASKIPVKGDKLTQARASKHADTAAASQNRRQSLRSQTTVGGHGSKMTKKTSYKRGPY
jgi:hypothetical protein